MSSAVEKIKEKVDIVSLVSTYIKLEKAGKNFKGKCPFHNEKTPSFFVSPERDSYYCFGCQAKGDIFNFVEQFEGLDFMGALKVLADRSGIKLDDFSFSDKSKTEKDRYISIMEMAKFYFMKNLDLEDTAKNYLLNRGLTYKTINDFSIGFSKNEWRGLYEFLLSKSISVKDMESIGLVKRKEGTDSYYDTFRGRVMFPIYDSSGRTIAFSGRILVPDENSPKYLNSPETILFKKSEVLYGLDKAKNHIRQMDYAILVEGQMDLVMLHQGGFLNTVASSGTSLTEEHLKRLQRLSNRVLMAYDGDDAGLKAMIRASIIALSLGMEVKVSSMPDRKDPADMVLENKELLKDIFKNSKNIVMFMVDSIIDKNKESHLILKKIIQEVLPVIARITSNSEKSFFIKYIKDKTGVKEESLFDDLRKISLEDLGIIKKEEKKYNSVIKEENDILQKIKGIILWQESLKEESPPEFVAILKSRIFDIMSDEEKKSFNLKEDSEALIFQAESYYSQSNINLEKHLNDLISSFHLEKLKAEFENTMILLNKAESIRDSEKVLEYLKKCQDISKQIEEIKKSYEKK